MNQPTPQGSANSYDSIEFLESQIVTVADTLGTRRIERVAEVGCTTNANPEAQAQVTRWEARTSLDVTSDAEANQMARALAKELSSEHWEGELGDLAPAEEPHRTLFQARSADGRFHIDFSQSKGGGENFVGVTIASECQKNPEGHQMVRSPLDPGYGKTDGGKYDVEAEKKALADGTATPAATPTAQPTQKP